MGCATSICSCTQTVATVTPRVASAHVTRHPGGQRRSANSQKSHLSPSVSSVDKKSSQWSSYDIEIRDFDEYSGPCEIESDGDSDSGNLCDRYNNNNKGDVHHGHPHHHKHHHHHHHNHGNLLTDQSKWTVTVKLYTKKAADERSADIPSVEETGSHYSSGEWHGKSSSSQGSRESAKGKAHRHAVPNGIMPKEYTRDSQRKPAKDKTNGAAGGGGRKRIPGKLHYSYSERPLTKEELARHESMINPSYAWANRRLGPGEQDPRVLEEHEQRLKEVEAGPHGFNGISVGLGNQQKYEHSGSMSQYLSLGTNHYKRSSLRGSNHRKKNDTEDNWQSLCDSTVMPSRPKSTMCVVAPDRIFNGFENGCDHDSNLSTSPIDSLITDYLVDTGTEIVEDFSGSTHSLNIDTSGKGTSVTTSAQDSQASPESIMPARQRRDSRRDSPIFLAESRHSTAKSTRPGAALRRHRSEPRHFLKANHYANTH